MDSYNQPDTTPVIGHSHGRGPTEDEEDPAMGGTFNATSEQAHEESVSELRRNRNKTLLNHPNKPLDASEEPPADRPAAHVPDIQPLTLPQPPKVEEQVPPPSTPTAIEPPPPPPLAPSDSAQPTQEEVDAARAAVEAAFGSQPFDPGHHSLEGMGAAPLTVAPELPPARSQPADPNQPQQFQIPK
jgi:hypothetical protein